MRYGNISLNSVTGTSLSLTLPANTTFVSATGGGLFDAPTNTVSWGLASLPAGAVALQEVEVTVNGGQASGILLESEAVISGLPLCVFGGLTAYLGLDLLHQWLKIRCDFKPAKQSRPDPF